MMSKSITGAADSCQYKHLWMTETSTRIMPHQWPQRQVGMASRMDWFRLPPFTSPKEKIFPLTKLAINHLLSIISLSDRKCSYLCFKKKFSAFISKPRILLLKQFLNSKGICKYSNNFSFKTKKHWDK